MTYFAPPPAGKMRVSRVAPREDLGETTSAAWHATLLGSLSGLQSRLFFSSLGSQRQLLLRQWQLPLLQSQPLPGRFFFCSFLLQGPSGLRPSWGSADGDRPVAQQHAFRMRLARTAIRIEAPDRRSWATPRVLEK